MNKHQSSPSSFGGENSSDPSEDAARAGQPAQGEAGQRQRRPRAPQFGSDRRNQRELNASRSKTARPHDDAGGLPRQPEVDGNRERRTGLQDRRQSASQYVHKEALR